MSANAKKNVNATDAVETTEETTAVPAQTKVETFKDVDGKDAIVITEETKMSLKDRVSGLVNKLKSNKKLLAGLGAAAAVAAIAFVKYSQTAQDAEAETTDELETDENPETPTEA